MPFLEMGRDYLTQPERHWQGTIIQYATMMGWHVRHHRATNARRTCKACGAEIRMPRDDAGELDLLLIRERIVWVEVKAERGRLSDAQKEEIARLRKAGQEVYVWRPSQWQEVEKVLR